MRRALGSILLAAVTIFSIETPQAPAQTTSLAQLGASYADFYTAAGGDRSDPLLRESLAALEHDTREVTRPGFLNSDGTWSDINYTEFPSGVWSPWDHFRRMTVMARAYSTPGQALYRNGQLLTQLEAALNQLPSFYGTTVKSPPGNWWFWVIGPALDLGPTLVLVRNDISPQTLSTATNVLRTRLGSSPWITPSGSVLQGQNLVWSALNHTALAILTNDTSRMNEAKKAIASTCTKVTFRDGIQADSSFQQHAGQLYTGGYGAAFAADVARYALITRGSVFELPDAELATFADYVADGIARTLFQNHFDVSVVGREVAKPSTSGWNGFAALLQMSSVPTARRTEITRAASRMMETWVGHYPVELAGLASSIHDSGIAGASPEGFSHFYASDYTVQRRRGWFASVKMHSTRTSSGERTNSENIRGARQSDGRFYMVLRGDEYFSNNVWPTLDWTRLPGTTVEQRPDAATGIYGLGTRNFVGGTGNGRTGISAMDYAPLGTMLSAKKSWFFLDDAIVFLTSSIRSTSGHAVETIVQQWPLTTVSTPLVVDGAARPSSAPWSESIRNPRWMTADGIGYYFPEPVSVEASRAVRKGSWSQLSSNFDPAEHSNPILTLWINHGAFPIGGSAAYAVVPNVTPASMRAWADSSPVRIVASDDFAHAVRDNRTGSLSIAFWQPGAVAGVSADQASLVHISEEGGGRVTVSAADPRQMSGKLKIVLPEALTLVSAGRPATVTNVGRTTVIEVQRNGGITTTVTLARPGRSRPARR
jgi:hyaluronate lyase